MPKSVSQDLVSVVVPSYARSATLLRALESINSQTYSPIEIVVVDDNGLGSAQQRETQERVGGFRTRQGVVVIYVPRAKNGGGAAARNTGIEASAGDYVAFLDDDDEYLPRKIELQIKAMQKTSADISYVHCAPDSGDSGDDTHYRHTEEGHPLFEQAYYGCLAATTQLLTRKDALLAVGGFTDSPAKQDSLLMYKMLLAGCAVCCVPEVLTLYHADPGLERISTRGKTLVGERIYSKQIRESYDRFTLNKRRKLEHAIRWREGRLLVKQGKKAEGFAQLALSFACAPVNACKKVVTVLGRASKK